MTDLLKIADDDWLVTDGSKVVAKIWRDDQAELPYTWTDGKEYYLGQTVESCHEQVDTLLEEQRG